MPVLPQAFWYNVDGKLKQVFFEEAKIPQEKRDLLLKQLQRSSRNYAGGVTSAPPADEQTGPRSTEKEKLYGWYPPSPGEQFTTVSQARVDKRVFQPSDHRAVQVIPDDRLREPVSTQIGPDGVPACIPPFPTDPMAYRFSIENTTQLPVAKAAPDFAKWESEEAGHIPQWNEVVAFHGTPLPPPDRPRTIAVIKEADVTDANQNDTNTLAVPQQQPQTQQQQTRPVSQPNAVPITASKSQAPLQQASTVPQERRSSSRGGVRVDATPVINVNKAVATICSGLPVVNNNSKAGGKRTTSNTNLNRHSLAATATVAEPPSLTLREIEEMQKKLSSEYRWRFNVHGDPFAVKSKVRPGRPAHWMPAKAEAPKPLERHVHYADSSTFFYNTIPIIPLSFSVGQGLASEKVIREREAKQKYAPKSTPNDRYFVPAFIY